MYLYKNNFEVSFAKMWTGLTIPSPDEKIGVPW
jgi:hypothetical protein